MQPENYYEYQRELMNLKEQLRSIKSKEKMNDLHCKLKILNNLKTELFHNLLVIRKNLGYVNENVNVVEPLLKSDKKISMKQECAASFKSVIQTMSILSNYGNILHQPKSNLNVDIEKLTDDIENNISDYKGSIHYTSLLFSNVQKLTNPNYLVEKQSNTENIQQDSPSGSSNATNDMITFSEAIASSPMQSYFMPSDIM